MKTTDIYYLERVKTTDYAFKEVKISATLDEKDDASEALDVLEILVRQQLGLDKKVLNVKTTESGSNESNVEKSVQQESSPEAKKDVPPKATRTRKTKASKAKEEILDTEIPEVIVTKDDVQNALRDVATHFKTAAKAVAIIEDIAKVKTLADVSPELYSAIIAKCKVVVG